MSMPALDSMLIVALTFLLAGSVKGVTGLGLPSVSLALLTATLGLKAAMAILIVPSFVTNVWQAAVGGYLLAILRRTWGAALCAEASRSTRRKREGKRSARCGAGT